MYWCTVWPMVRLQWYNLYVFNGKVAPSGLFIRLIGYNLAPKINYTLLACRFLRFPIVTCTDN